MEIESGIEGFRVKVFLGGSFLINPVIWTKRRLKMLDGFTYKMKTEVFIVRAADDLIPSILFFFWQYTRRSKLTFDQLNQCFKIDTCMLTSWRVSAVETSPS